MLAKVLEQSKYLVWIAVVSTWLGAIAAFGWGAYKTVKLILELMNTAGSYPTAKIAFLELMDAFLIAAAMLVFTFGMYELFIDKLSLPKWLVIHNLHELKAKIGSVAVLVMVITFLEHLVEWKDPQGTLCFAIAVTLVSGVLIAFGHFGGED